MSSKGNAKASKEVDASDDVIAKPLRKKTDSKESVLFVTRDKVFDLSVCGFRATKRLPSGKLVFEFPKALYDSHIKNDFRIKQGLLVPYEA